MIGGLQGDFGNLDIKYLKQKISKMSVANIGKLKRISKPCKRAAKFRSMKDTISHPKADFATLLLILQPKADFAALQNWPSTLSDRILMAVTPSFQL